MTTQFSANVIGLYEAAVQALSRLSARVASGSALMQEFTTTQRFLDALPLTTEEAAVLSNRLANAMCYVEAGERGAASYEVRLAARSAALTCPEMTTKPRWFSRRLSWGDS